MLPKIVDPHIPLLPLYEPAHDKTYNQTCANSEDSEQPAYPPSLTRVFADRICPLELPDYAKQDEREHLLYWVDVQADLSHCWPITKTCLYKVDLLKPHFYIVKLGFKRVYIIFLISAQKHRLWVLVRTASPRRF